MEMDIDKSEDELELERLVFGDSESIKQQLKAKKDTEKPVITSTNLEHLEDDQVIIPPCLFVVANVSYSSLTQERRKIK